MIRNDDELQVVQKQLVTAHEVLTSLGRDIYPVNPKLYELMADPCEEEILRLDRLIWDYKGKLPNHPIDLNDPQTQITLKIGDESFPAVIESWGLSSEHVLIVLKAPESLRNALEATG